MMASELLSDPDTATRCAKAGYAVYGIDYEGHGKSSGLQGYVPSFQHVVNDCSDYFVGVCGMNSKSMRSQLQQHFKF